MISIPLAPTQAQGLSATPDAANALITPQASGAFQAIFAAVSAARPGVAEMTGMAPSAATPSAGEFLGVPGLVVATTAGQAAQTPGTAVLSPTTGLVFPADAAAGGPAPTGYPLQLLPAIPPVAAMPAPTAVVPHGTAMPGQTAASEAIAAYGRTGDAMVADAGSIQGTPHAGRQNEADATGPDLASATPATIPSQPSDILAAPASGTPAAVGAPSASDTQSGEAGALDVVATLPQQEAASSQTQSAPIWLPVQGPLPAQPQPGAAVAPTQAATPGTIADGFRPMADGSQPPAQPPLAVRPSATGSSARPSTGSDAAAHSSATGSAPDAPSTSPASPPSSASPGAPATAADAGRPADRVTAPLAQPGFETQPSAKIPAGKPDAQAAAAKPAAGSSAVASTVPASTILTSQPAPPVGAGARLPTDGTQQGATLSPAAIAVDTAPATHTSGFVSPTTSIPASASTSAIPTGPGTGASPALVGPAMPIPSDAIRIGGPAMPAPELAAASAIPAPALIAEQWGTAPLTTAIQPALAQSTATGASRGMAQRATAGSGFAAQLADQAPSAEPVAGAAAARTAQAHGVAAIPETAPVATDFAAAGEQARADTALPIAQTAGHRSEAPAEIVDARHARQAAHAATTQVAVAVVRAVADGVERISIKLQPPELGRIDVRLDVGADGRVQAYVLAERPATLEILQRDSRELERALNGAGLDTANGGLSFGLRQNGNGQAGGDGPAGQERRQGPENRPADAPPPPLPQPSRAAASGRLDIQV
ncbi:MAG: flagellar hook-length control protein FliK [Rhodospirillales bacterium]